ncbi:MAG: hypothetical protein R3E31_08885 [Chloroflexota bacterium]
MGLVPLLVLADEWWVDLPGMFPPGRRLFQMALPLLLTLLGLWLIYMLLRRGEAAHSEALTGVFTLFLSV